MSRNDRRSFLKTTAAAGAGFALFNIAGTKASGKIIGANDTIRVGVAGINGRGNSHIDGLAGMKNVDVTHLIDPDSRLFDSKKAKVKAKGGNEPKTMQNILEALDDKNLDAVTVATCNHWHSLITVWAAQRGKHVYVEKPLSHNVFEGRQCAAAQDKYNVVIQHGTQTRSSGGTANVMAAIHEEKYGKLLISKGYCCKPRWSIGKKNVGAPPKGFDFSQWLGPAKFQEYHGKLHPYNWHWFWDFGNGDTGNQGVHQMDVARWAIKDGTLPNEIWSLGGRFTPPEQDQGQTPNMQLSVMDFNGVLLVFETRGLVDSRKYPKAPPRNVSNEFYTTEGVIRGSTFTPKNGGKSERVKPTKSVDVVSGGPFGSWISTIRSGNPKDSNCDAHTGHYSSALCHLPNISYRLGEQVAFDKKAKTLGDNKVVVEAFDKVVDNLKAVDLQLSERTYMLGRVLKFDPKTEKFIGDDQANQMLTRDYRKGYEVPEVS